MTTTSPRRSPRKTSHPSHAPKERHCKRCPGRPLLRECEHSAKAKKQVARQSRRHEAQSAKTPAGDPTTNSSASQAPNSPSPAPSRETAPRAETPIDPALLGPNEGPVGPPLYPLPAHLRGAPQMPTPSPQPANSSISCSSPARPSTQSSPHPAGSTFITFNGDNATFNADHINNNRSMHTDDDDKDDQDTNKCVRVSKKNPVYGFVRGSMRGEIPWDVPRRHPKEPYEASRELRTKAFNERVKRIVERCEEVANVTGCWLYFSAHLSTSNHGFVHFVSKNLNADAGGALDEIHSLHSNLYTSLSKATIRNVAEVEMEAAKTREELRKTKEAEASALTAVDSLQRSIADKDKIIEELRSVLLARGEGSVS
ncbi:hypothetical protein VNI00_018154 [Paramarasmius palmivorus]|uniref:Uncharacterized protein n=1 Tax=Paramarasmius palmivorus TaxID=297713 RepID=A0AAW0B117_9AGAR